MTIRLEHSIFCHVPRTAGVWFRAALAEAKVKAHVLIGDYDSHLRWRDLPNESWKRLPAFSFVRHPWAWLKSRWTIAVDRDTPGDQTFFGMHRAFDELVAPTLAVTMENILARRPGIYGATLQDMLSGKAIRLARTEDLPGAACSLLRDLEELPEAQLAAIRACPPANSTATNPKYAEELAAVPPGLVSAWLAAESLALEIWEGAKR